MRTSEVPDGRWEAEPAAAAVGLAVRKLGVHKVRLSFPIDSLQVEVVNGEPASVVATIDVGGLDSRNDLRDRKLRGPRFLDLAAGSRAEFTSSSVTQVSGRWIVRGTLSFHGHDAPLTLEINELEIGPEGARVRASGALDRRSLGVRHAPRWAIGTDVEVTVSARLGAPGR